MQSRAAKQREIANRTASGKHRETEAQKRDLCLLREREPAFRAVGAESAKALVLDCTWASRLAGMWS